MDTTTGSVPHVSGSGVCADALSKTEPGSPGRYQAAAEGLAQAFISLGHDGSAICQVCHRGSLGGTLAHLPWCGPGVLLEQGEALRQLRAKVGQLAGARPKGPIHTIARVVPEDDLASPPAVERRTVCGAMRPSDGVAPVSTCDLEIGHERSKPTLQHFCEATGMMWPTGPQREAADLALAQQLADRLVNGDPEAGKPAGLQRLWPPAQPIESDESWQASEAILRAESN